MPRTARLRPTLSSVPKAQRKSQSPRQLPVGADVLSAGGVAFRVWAPKHDRVDLVLGQDGTERVVRMEAAGEGYFECVADDASAGTRYGYRLGGGERAYPDPASRFQPDGPHGRSEVVDPSTFSWSDHDWAGVPETGHVTYEMHVGTFTPEGTWAAAARELDVLAELGITLLEVMPIADFPGRFGWGYDGVNLFAPTRLYGLPDDVRRFVDAAHRAGIGVILDVVYNHFGPDGNYLLEFSADYISKRHASEWGESPNYDGDNSGPVRELIIANAGYWIDEFHFDGLRLDATQQIFDDSPVHVMADITAEVQRCAGGRGIHIVAENEPQDVRLLGPRERGGYGMHALWNDDFHHSARVALTGHAEAYYTDYAGSPQEFISAMKRGFLYQGQWYSWQKNRRGTATRGIAIDRFVAFLENHDQVANTGLGRRLHQLVSPGSFRAMTSLLLLGPQSPLLFQGQEYGARQPFNYFADHGDAALHEAVRNGRGEFLRQFPSLATDEMQRLVPDPGDIETFRRCTLDPRERRAGGPMWSLHQDLIRLRRDHAALTHADEVDGAVLGPDAFLLRYLRADGDDRLLIVSLGHDTHLCPASEPLLGPPAGKDWAVAWSSDDPRYGGEGTTLPVPDDWLIPGRCALLLHPVERKAYHDRPRPARRTA
jgi:maltooligosyltrehalose trehalohydrolase